MLIREAFPVVLRLYPKLGTNPSQELGVHVLEKSSVLTAVEVLIIAVPVKQTLKDLRLRRRLQLDSAEEHLLRRAGLDLQARLVSSCSLSLLRHI